MGYKYLINENLKKTINYKSHQNYLKINIKVCLHIELCISNENPHKYYEPVTHDSFLLIALQYTFFLLSKRLKGFRAYSRTSLFYEQMLLPYMYKGKSLCSRLACRILFRADIP